MCSQDLLITPSGLEIVAAFIYVISVRAQLDIDLICLQLRWSDNWTVEQQTPGSAAFLGTRAETVKNSESNKAS